MLLDTLFVKDKGRDQRNEETLRKQVRLGPYETKRASEFPVIF